MSAANQGSFEVLKVGDNGEVRLAMESLWLTGRILPVGARLVVVHTFRSAESGPLEVVYAFGLPRDAALRRFKVIGDGFQVRSELHPVAEAQELYEQGIQQGHLATLARAYRDGRVNLSVGNIRPGELVKVFLELVAGVDLRDEGLRFRFPFTLAPCYHGKAQGVEVEPGRLEMTLPEEEFGDLLLPQWLEESSGLHRVGFGLSAAWAGEIKEVGSPSHRIRVTQQGDGEARVTLAAASDMPNRDLVLDVRGEQPSVRSYGGASLQHRSHVSIVVPSIYFGASTTNPRHVIFLLDRSGSMEGVPLEQAKQALTACLGALEPRDRFNLLAFNDGTEWFRKQSVPATPDLRHEAEEFLNRLRAGGGTELGPALEHALLWAKDSGGADVFLLTDGQVAATEDLINRVRDAAIRVHCLGIGSASQDRFLVLLAEATGAVSRMVTPRERVDVEALELFASAGSCLARKLGVSVQTQPELRWVLPPRPVVFAGYPLVLMGQADGVPQGRLRFCWEDGAGERRETLELPATSGQDAGTVRLLHGAKLISQVESTEAPEIGVRAFTARRMKRWQQKLESLGREYGLANRALSLVAVVERSGDDAAKLPKTLVVPVGMPEDVELAAYKAPRASVGITGLVGHCESFALSRSPRSASLTIDFLVSPGAKADDGECLMALAPPSSSRLLELAGRLDADGAVPGDGELRLIKSLTVLGMFLAAGNTMHLGPLRPHVRRLVRFIRSQLASLKDPAHRALAEGLLLRAEADASSPREQADLCQLVLTLPDNDASIGQAWQLLAAALGD